MKTRYRAVWSPGPEGLGVKPYVVERKVGWWSDWEHVTRIDDVNDLHRVATEYGSDPRGRVVREIVIE